MPIPSLTPDVQATLRAGAVSDGGDDQLPAATAHASWTADAPLAPMRSAPNALWFVVAGLGATMPVCGLRAKPRFRMLDGSALGMDAIAHAGTADSITWRGADVVGARRVRASIRTAALLRTPWRVVLQFNLAAEPDGRASLGKLGGMRLGRATMVRSWPAGVRNGRVLRQVGRARRVQVGWLLITLVCIACMGCGQTGGTGPAVVIDAGAPAVPSAASAAPAQPLCLPAAYFTAAIDMSPCVADVDDWLLQAQLLEEGVIARVARQSG